MACVKPELKIELILFRRASTQVQVIYEICILLDSSSYVSFNLIVFFVSFIFNYFGETINI
jgi:hypothetical protein